MFPACYTNSGVCMRVAVNPLKWHLKAYRRTFITLARFPLQCRFSNVDKGQRDFPHDLLAVSKFVFTLGSPGDLLKIPKSRPHYQRMKSQSLEMGQRHQYFLKPSDDSTVQTPWKPLWFPLQSYRWKMEAGGEQSLGNPGEGVHSWVNDDL